MGQHRERSSLGFCVSGRCFVVVRRGKRHARAMGNEEARPCEAPPKAIKRGQVMHVACAGRSGRHHKAPSPSGRALTQQTGECRRRTHESDGALSAPAPAGLATGTSTNRHCRPTRDWPTFNGRLEVECGRSAGGSPQQSGDGREDPSGASGLSDPQRKVTSRPDARRLVREGLKDCSLKGR